MTLRLRFLSIGKNGYDLNWLGVADIPENEKDDNNKVELLVNKRLSGLDGEEISEMVQLSQQCILNNIIKKRENDNTYCPTLIASIPQIRMTRHIVSEYILDDNEVHKHFDDSIGLVSNWKKRGPIELPQIVQTVQKRVLK